MMPSPDEPSDVDSAADSQPQGGKLPNPSFAGARVASFESRQHAAMEQLIRKHGGVPFVSPSMQEAPETDANAPALQEFAHRLFDGSLDTVIAMTGVGFKYMLDVLSARFPRQRILDFLSDITTISRGPKPNAAMHQAGVVANYKVPPPHTWRDILSLIDANALATNRQVAVLEYGETNPSLIAGLEARGALVLPVTIYRWTLPDDIEPLKQNIQRLLDGQIDVVLFTSAQQVVHLLQVAETLGCRSAIIGVLNEVVVASIGPTTSERLLELGIPVTIEAEVGKMARLVSTVAGYWHTRQKESSGSVTASRLSKSLDHRPPPAQVPESSLGHLMKNVEIMLEESLLEQRRRAEKVATTFPDQPWYHGPFLKACRREPTDVTPIWLMRQAGRYMAEYQAVRANHSFLELCKNPRLCSEVMNTAVARLGVDAAIIFSDLLPILEPMGFELSFGPGQGPQIHNPIREAKDVDRVRPLSDMSELGFVVDTVRFTRADLPNHIPVIGFGGAPFTLASYCIEGGGSRSFTRTKRLMYESPEAWHDLLRRLTDSAIVYLNAQVAAGAGCLQLFDSWVGALSPYDYETYVFPHMQRLLAGLAKNVPVINFGTGNPELLPYYAAARPAVVGVDWRIELDRAWNVIGPDFAVQGNLDPLVLLGPRSTISEQTNRILKQAAGRPGHIFNVGHGIVPETPVQNVIELVDMVHQRSAK